MDSWTHEFQNGKEHEVIAVALSLSGHSVVLCLQEKNGGINAATAALLQVIQMQQVKETSNYSKGRLRGAGEGRQSCCYKNNFIIQ